jgi:Rieske Fe-S protein
MEPISRRKMLRRAVIVTGGICSCPSLLADEKKSTCCNTPEISAECYTVSKNSISVDLNKTDTLNAFGEAATIVNDERGFHIIIVRASEKEYLALSRICTHGGNVVNYNNKRNILQCNNYNHSIFDLKGQVVKGPATEPLHVYPVKWENNKLLLRL